MLRELLLWVFFLVLFLVLFWVFFLVLESLESLLSELPWERRLVVAVRVVVFCFVLVRLLVLCLLFLPLVVVLRFVDCDRVLLVEEPLLRVVPVEPARVELLEGRALPLVVVVALR